MIFVTATQLGHCSIIELKITHTHYLQNQMLPDLVNGPQISNPCFRVLYCKNTSQFINPIYCWYHLQFGE